MFESPHRPFFFQKKNVRPVFSNAVEYINYCEDIKYNYYSSECDMTRHFTRLRLVKYLGISHSDSCNKQYYLEISIDMNRKCPRLRSLNYDRIMRKIASFITI